VNRDHSPVSAASGSRSSAVRALRVARIRALPYIPSQAYNSFYFHNFAMISRPSTGSGPAVQLTGLSKSFDDKVAVRSLDLSVPRGSTYGLIGPNGAGKTTTIRMMLRVIDPDAGRVEILGEPLSQDSLAQIGYLPEERGIYRQMRVRRLLQFFAELKGMPRREAGLKIAHWLERFELADRANSKVQELSKGNQQKIQFIASILHEPEIMVMDEPFSGLDPINQLLLKDIIVDLKRAGKTIIFSTHIIEHAERICDHVCIIARGDKVADGTMSQVKRIRGENYVAITFDPWTREASSALRAASVVSSVRENGPTAEVTLRPGSDPQELLRHLVSAGVRLKRFDYGEPSLEQVFLETVGAPDDVISQIGAAHV
jgi:ABC-2 type transport system ATP-binding protein